MGYLKYIVLGLWLTLVIISLTQAAKDCLQGFTIVLFIDSLIGLVITILAIKNET